MLRPYNQCQLKRQFTISAICSSNQNQKFYNMTSLDDLTKIYSKSREIPILIQYTKCQFLYLNFSVMTDNLTVWKPNLASAGTSKKISYLPPENILWHHQFSHEDCTCTLHLILCITILLTRAQKHKQIWGTSNT